MEKARVLGHAPITLNDAADKFWTQVGIGHADADKTFVDLKRVVEFIGPNKLLEEITGADVANMVAWRRGQKAKGKKTLVSPATVNRSTTEVLKKVFGFAKRVLGYHFPKEPNWRAHMLKEPQGIVRELRDDEEEKLDAAMRADYAPWIEFALLTGRRRGETIIRWKDVDWQARLIVTKGKGDNDVVTVITEEVAAILESQMGKHSDFVFTYEAKRSSKARDVIRGARYPITYEGGKTEWQRLRKRAGVTEFRFHDFRHTTATRLVRETGNLKLVQKALNHRNITTTSRYAHVSQDDVADAMQRVASARRARSDARKAKTSPDEKTSPGGSPQNQG